MRRAASLIALVFVLAGCSSEPAEAERARGRFVVDTAHDAPEVQDATLDAFASSVDAGEAHALAILDTTIDGGQVVYAIQPQAAIGYKELFYVTVDASGDPAWTGPTSCSYVFPNARVVLTRATPDATKLAPGASSARAATHAINVLTEGRIVFDSAKSKPILPSAKYYLVK